MEVLVTSRRVVRKNSLNFLQVLKKCWRASKMSSLRTSHMDCHLPRDKMLDRFHNGSYLAKLTCIQANPK
ncbi:hypothetical protein CR513_43561, partial [Mucuna pruriens]